MQYLNTAHPHNTTAFITQDKVSLHIHNIENFNQIHKYKTSTEEIHSQKGLVHRIPRLSCGMAGEVHRVMAQMSLACCTTPSNRKEGFFQHERKNKQTSHNTRKEPNLKETNVF